MSEMGRRVICQMMIGAVALSTANARDRLKVRISWGHTSPERTNFFVQFSTREAGMAEIAGIGLEVPDRIDAAICETSAGNGDVDGAAFTLEYMPAEVEPAQKIHSFWADYFALSDADTVRRLQQDPAYRPDPRTLTVQMDREGTTGFSLTIDQLLQNNAFWIPALDVYVAAGEDAPSFDEHQSRRQAQRGRRVLEQVRHEPEATYEQYTARWEDMGSPAYQHPSQPAPGHIVGLTWDSALYKFGIDGGAGVWNDYGNPDRLRFWFDFGERGAGVPPALPRQDAFGTSQRLHDGLPVITTTIERGHARYVVEQFAYPLNGPPAERRGDIPMVLLQKIAVINPQDSASRVSIGLHHRRQFASDDASEMIRRQEGEVIVFEESAKHRVLFTAQGPGLAVASCITKTEPPREKEKTCWKDCEATLTLDLPANATREFVVKLASPMVAPEDRDALSAMDYDQARDATLKFWSDWVGRGAQFRVPEKAVNDRFWANLWHALRLPRRHGGQEDGVRIDLPYSNFAYDQHGTPWPINQAVYVDYMLYDLRGYHDVAAEELLTMYRNNQEPNGHVKGYANWGVYTPAMVYVAAKHYLLSGDRKAFERLLPPTLKALDWCLKEVREAPGGLIRSPLNDLTGDGVWAFTQAYIYAAFDTLGKALERAGHPRAPECLRAAEDFRKAVARAFGAAVMRAPLVPLRDQSWTPYVPCEAGTPRRLLEQWYPADVDTGAMHLLRLKALPARGVLAEALLNDHEDNLYLYGWGMANEPVYNPQATAYLLRDEPLAAVRAFYSYMACAFSHSVLEPVEHRWIWGQYFGPPSTDGAWFELYRNMLIHELDDDTLFLLQATPRQWLADGQQIAVERAPTYYGEVSLAIDSRAAAGTLTARVEMPRRQTPKRLIVRFRHPQAQPMRSVTVNGHKWTRFDAQKEWVIIEGPSHERYVIEVHY